MKSIDNFKYKLGDDLHVEIRNGSKIQICASIFSMYGFNELRKELQGVEELKFVFTSPIFNHDPSIRKEKKKFEIDSFLREKALTGTEFEVKLKNELKSKEIAQECASWIREKVTFKTNTTEKSINNEIIIENDGDVVYYQGTGDFNTVGLGYEKGNVKRQNVIKLDIEDTMSYYNGFNEMWNNDEDLKDVTDEVVQFIETLYVENSPDFIYYVTLYNIFNEFLEDITEDEIANEKTGFKESKIWNTLYDFQKDAVLGIINKLERHNGCILADSVGLGKTFTALAVIKYYQEKNLRTLVLCPKKLSENWNTYKDNYKDNILHEDRFNYSVLYHTDLSRKSGLSNGVDLSRVNWSNFDLVVIDESHNFRNHNARSDRETRYDILMNEVMKLGVPTKVLMLSATPVNNKFKDLKNQIALAYEGRTNEIDEKISEDKSIDTILRNAQIAFNEWSRLDSEERTTQVLLDKLNSNFDFFKLLDSVTIARSRKHIQKYYDMEKIGKFPKRLNPISRTPDLTDIARFITVDDIAKSLIKLNMSVYSMFDYILEPKLELYSNMYDNVVRGGSGSFKQSDREKSLQKLMRINLLKRLESSVFAFRKTLNSILEKIEDNLKAIENFEKNKTNIKLEDYTFNEYDTEYEDEDYTVGKKVVIDLKDMNTDGWKRDLVADYTIIKELLFEMEKITPDRDSKLQNLISLINEKNTNKINENNSKVIVFSAFADTANYLYENIVEEFIKDYNIAKVTGSGKNECTLKIDSSYNSILTNFSPISKNRKLLHPELTHEIDILIATDCISEGQNLQDCDYLINYDIHWNPVRIIQRFGRIDRIGSKNESIQLVNFWPNISLDDYINLKNRVENRMSMLDISATGEDNVLTNQSNDMNYRNEQLKKLKEEVIDIEDMNTGVSITDLGLNEFRMDLLEYIDKNREISRVPNGMHSVVFENKDIEAHRGAIFVLKNINQDVNINNMNQIHPFYLVYISTDGEVICNHLDVKRTLDILRSIAVKEKEPIKEAYTMFNSQTKDGKNMKLYSELLNDSINSIIDVKTIKDIDSIFSEGGTSFLKNNINGLDDFELITFMVVV